MSWYRIGTASLTNGSKVVTGSGTAWAANVQAGDAFHAPDGKVYEIDFVSADASLNLVDAYAGTTASGQSYKVQPTQGRVRDLAAAVSTLITEYGSIESALTVLSGNVGIGTAAPNQKLEVAGTAVRVSATSPWLELYSAGIVNWSVRANNAGAADFTVFQNNTERLRLTNAGSFGIGTDNPAARLAVSNDGASGFEVSPAGGVSGGPALVSYNRSGSAYMQCTNYALAHTWWVYSQGRSMDLDTNGNLGIGTSTPLFKLDVSGLAAVGTKTASPGAGGNIRYRDDTGTARYAVGITGAAAETGWSIYDLVASVERLRLDSAGNTIKTLTDTAPALTAARQLVMNRVSDTQVRISMRGADGTTRSTVLTLS